MRPGVEVKQAEVQAIDPERSRVRTGDKELEYDYLVVALGADLAPEVAPGFGESAHNFFDLTGAAGLWSALQQFQSGRVAVVVSAMPYKCPAAPYETAMLLDDALRRRGVRDRSKIHLFTPEPQPMPVAGPLMGEVVVSMLAAKDIGFQPNLPLDHIDAAGRTLVFKDGRKSLSTSWPGCRLTVHHGWSKSRPWLTRPVGSRWTGTPWPRASKMSMLSAM